MENMGSGAQVMLLNTVGRDGEQGQGVLEAPQV